MDGLNRLLLDRLHGHRPNLTTPGRFEERLAVRAIGLTASHIRAHVLDRQEPDA